METLTRFNQQILQCQDDAYTLAWYLLGDEAEAEAVLQKAVEAAYHCFESRQNNCRLLILKQVVNQCRERKSSACGAKAQNMPFDLDCLDPLEHPVLVLVDGLGLKYIDAACVVDLQAQDIARLLAQARGKIMAQKEFATS